MFNLTLLHLFYSLTLLTLFSLHIDSVNPPESAQTHSLKKTCFPGMITSGLSQPQRTITMRYVFICQAKSSGHIHNTYGPLCLSSDGPPQRMWMQTDHAGPRQWDLSSFIRPKTTSPALFIIWACKSYSDKMRNNNWLIFEWFVCL